MVIGYTSFHPTIDQIIWIQTSINLKSLHVAIALMIVDNLH